MAATPAPTRAQSESGPVPPAARPVPTPAEGMAAGTLSPPTACIEDSADGVTVSVVTPMGAGVASWAETGAPSPRSSAPARTQGTRLSVAAAACDRRMELPLLAERQVPRMYAMGKRFQLAGLLD